MTKNAGSRRTMSAAIKEKARELGYASCGITDAGPFPEFVDGLEARVQRYPESAHLYDDLRDNAYPKRRAAWAESMIVCISRYGKYRLPQEPTRYFGKTYLVDGRLPYAAEYRAVDAFERWGYR